MQYVFAQIRISHQNGYFTLSDGGASDACVCEKGFDGRYCQNGKVKLPLSVVGAGSPAVVIVPVILIVIIVLVLIGLYIYWRDPFFMRR